jgi:hypothetical protein
MTPVEKWTLIFSGISAFATAISVILVIIAATFTYQQVREASRARQLESALAVLDLIDSPEHRQARRIVYLHHQQLNELVKRKPNTEQLDSFFKSVSEDKVDFSCFHSYLAFLEHISVLVLHDLAPDSIINMYFGHMTPRHWDVLEPLVLFMRSVYGSDDFLQHFEMLNTLVKKNGLRVDKTLRPNLIGRLKDKLLLDDSGCIKQQLLRDRRISRQEYKKSDTINGDNKKSLRS